MKQSGAADNLLEAGGAATPDLARENNLAYRHFARPEPLAPPDGAKTVSLRSLYNRINHIHFSEGTLQAYFRNMITGETFFLNAAPMPCTGDELSCFWSDNDTKDHPPNDFEFMGLAIEDSHSHILIFAEILHSDREGFTVRLPMAGYDAEQRLTQRYPCEGIHVELSQGGVSAKGGLVDFTPFGFRIRVKTKPAAMMRWFNVELPATLSLHGNEGLIFSSPCMYMHHNGDHEPLEMVLAPAEVDYPAEPDGNRNPAQRLVPSPALVIEHPLLGKPHRLRVSQVATSGFVVQEDAQDAVLIPGLTIRNASLEFAGGMTIHCSVRVNSRYDKDEGIFSYFVEITDMRVSEYERLSRILISALDPAACHAAELDTDALWEFLFDTGFIYPKKYALIHAHGNELKETCRKIYHERSEIAAHFACQKGGRIQAHISMVKAYERAWMIHHHAARGKNLRRSGVSVLKQVMFHLNDMHRLPSAAMDYAMAFFRPENRFPDHIFGGFARYLDDQGGCSLDTMAYLTYTTLSLHADLPDGWDLKEVTDADLSALKRSYAATSGGLLLKAMGLDNSGREDGSLEAVFGEAGLCRTRKSFALAYRGEALAVLVMDRSDLGLNLSELLNGIKALIIDEERLSWRVLSIAVSKLARNYPLERVPVLFHPFTYTENHNVPFEKLYHAWVLDVRHGDEYMRYMRKKFRVKYN
ncbi:MAG: hypothetical protein JRJ60_15225 [Deltaproteobacteria bacterium]|nr:hypothetical protein [Deltaproteobacteria bacterium]